MRNQMPNLQYNLSLTHPNGDVEDIDMRNLIVLIKFLLKKEGISEDALNKDYNTLLSEIKAMERDIKIDNILE